MPNDTLTEGRLFDLPEKAPVTVKDRFTAVPFTVLDGRAGWWQDRKQQWSDMGLRSEEGRTAKTFGKGGGKDEVTQKILELSGGQSIFDPVLCELMYRWYCPPGGSILDPFAGGSVRGLVAAVLHREYCGIDLAPVQIETNVAQAKAMETAFMYPVEQRPTWINGDSSNLDALLDGTYDAGAEFDMVFSCPPYFDLEVYSKDPADLSNMAPTKFEKAYRDIIGASVARLRDNSFAVFVVGDVRDKKGIYRNLPGITIDAFEKAGMNYYNEVILVNMVGTLALRITKQFRATRKMGRTHQNVLIFVKGDPAKAVTYLSESEGLIEADLAVGVETDVPE